MRTTRRGFLGILTTIGAVLGVYDDTYSKDTLDLQYYRGYRLKWTGWKEGPGNDLQFAQWVALPEVDGQFDHSRPRLYVAVPGNRGPYFKGQCFDVSLQPGQKIIESWTHPVVKEREKKRAGKTLIRLIDDFYDGKIIWSPDPVYAAGVPACRYRPGDIVEIKPFKRINGVVA